MMEYKFNDTIVYICEDTARAIIYDPTEDNHLEIIDWIDTSNFVCAGVYTDNEIITNAFNYYCSCPVSPNKNDIQEIETSFT